MGAKSIFGSRSKLDNKDELLRLYKSGEVIDFKSMRSYDEVVAYAAAGSEILKSMPEHTDRIRFISFLFACNIHDGPSDRVG